MHRHNRCVSFIQLTGQLNETCWLVEDTSLDSDDDEFFFRTTNKTGYEYIALVIAILLCSLTHVELLTGIPFSKSSTWRLFTKSMRYTKPCVLHASMWTIYVFIKCTHFRIFIKPLKEQCHFITLAIYRVKAVTSNMGFQITYSWMEFS